MSNKKFTSMDDHNKGTRSINFPSYLIYKKCCVSGNYSYELIYNSLINLNSHEVATICSLLLQKPRKITIQYKQSFLQKANTMTFQDLNNFHNCLLIK